MAEISGAVKSLPSMRFFQSVPICRFTDATVRSGLDTAWCLATWPTRRVPSLVKPTTEGVVLPPSALGMTRGLPPSISAMHEFVVPRSMPIIFSFMTLTPCSHQNDASERDATLVTDEPDAIDATDAIHAPPCPRARRGQARSG